MILAEKILYRLSKNKVKKQVENLKTKDKESRGIEYAQSQYNKYLKRGFKIDIHDKKILEIGCGHGGISCFLAMNGAKEVYGLDINEYNLEIANKFKKSILERMNVKNIPVEYINENVHDLDFKDDYFDIIIADNVFEHFDDNIAVMIECKRVLKKGGVLVVPSFPSIYSKNGAHLKKGIAVPWVYAFFKEKTIINVLKRNAIEHQLLHEVYEGLKENPDNIRDLRKYKDLNYITNRKFKKQSIEAGLKINKFEVLYVSRMAKLFSKLIVNKYSIIHDILSLKSIAILKKV